MKNSTMKNATMKDSAILTALIILILFVLLMTSNEAGIIDVEEKKRPLTDEQYNDDNYTTEYFLKKI